MTALVHRIAASIPADMLRLSLVTLRRDICGRYGLADRRVADRAIELARMGAKASSLRERGLMQ